jgi:hypothetical protein
MKKETVTPPLLFNGLGDILNLKKIRRKTKSFEVSTKTTSGAVISITPAENNFLYNRCRSVLVVFLLLVLM